MSRTAQHPDAAFLLSLPELVAPAGNNLESHVGRYCRLKTWKAGDGTIYRDRAMLITGTQRDYRGEVCYRVRSGSLDTFGSAKQADLVALCDAPDAAEWCRDEFEAPVDIRGRWPGKTKVGQLNPTIAKRHGCN